MRRLGLIVADLINRKAKASDALAPHEEGDCARCEQSATEAVPELDSIPVETRRAALDFLEFADLVREEVGEDCVVEVIRSQKDPGYVYRWGTGGAMSPDPEAMRRVDL